MRAFGKTLAVTGAVLVSVVVLPAAAWAGTGTTGSTGADFATHVVACQQTMGLDGQHNPGMHDGYSGWDPASMP